MQYNTQREKLQMPEYGRGIQDMIDYAVSITDREERQRCAETIFRIMMNMQPQLREQPDYSHRIWDHIAYISHYQLDIDYPCEIVRLDNENQKPQPLNYPMKNIGQRQYGYLIEVSLRELAEMPEGEERDEMLALVANQMKQNLFIWNRDATEDEIRRIYAAKSDEFNSYLKMNFAGDITDGIAAPVMPGVLDLLNKVREEGLMRVIVTGSGQRSLLNNLNKHFPGIFTQELMVTAFDVRKGKPYPEPYLMGLKKAGLSADEAVVVENAPLGVQAAVAAGIFTIAVNTGPLPDKVLSDAGADIVFPSMQAFADAWPIV